MDTQEILNDRIEAYLAGTLSSPQNAEFERQLTIDENLRNEVQRHQKAGLAIKHGFNQSIKTRLKVIEKEIGKAETKPSRRAFFVKRLAIAASFLLMIAAGTHFYAHRAYRSTFIAENLFVPAAVETFRGREEYVTSLGEKFSEAEHLFREGSYDAARQRYLFIIHEDSLLKGQAEWNLALCYYAQDPESQQFKQLFERILADSAHDYHAQAVKLNKTMASILYRLVHR